MVDLTLAEVQQRDGRSRQVRPTGRMLPGVSREQGRLAKPTTSHAAATAVRDVTEEAAHHQTLFSVAFHTAKGDADLVRMSRVLNMTLHLYPKLPVVADMPGVSRLDFFSGLFLVHGDAHDEWRLEGRTWGVPAAETVHRWHLNAADAAHLVDPTVRLPPRLAAIAAASPEEVAGSGGPAPTYL